MLQFNRPIEQRLHEVGQPPILILAEWVDSEEDRCHEENLALIGMLLTEEGEDEFECHDLAVVA